MDEDTVYPAIYQTKRNKAEGRVNPFRKVRKIEKPQYIRDVNNNLTERSYTVALHKD